VTGMLLRGYPVICVIVMVIVVCVEMLGLTFWVWRAYRKKAVQKCSGKIYQSESTWAKEEEMYFALGDNDDSDLDDVKEEVKKCMTEADHD